MPDLFYVSDRGEAIFEDGKAYRRVGAVIGQPNDNDPDVDSIGSITYNVADVQGKTVYTAIQRAVSSYEIGNYDSPANNSYATWTDIFTAPAHGVIRVYGTVVQHQWRINGGSSLGNMPGSELDSAPMNLTAGDVVSINSSDWFGQVFVSFFPFVYPIV